MSLGLPIGLILGAGIGFAIGYLVYGRKKSVPGYAHPQQQWGQQWRSPHPQQWQQGVAQPQQGFPQHPPQHPPPQRGFGPGPR